MWAIVMLHEDTDEASVSEISNDLRRYLPGVELYFPALTQRGTLAWEHGFSGYVFAGASADANFSRLQRSKFVAQLVQSTSRQTYELLTDAQLREIRHSARPAQLRRGSAVRILAGDCTGLSGQVLALSKASNSARVEIRLHSRRFEVQVSLHEIERV